MTVSKLWVPADVYEMAPACRQQVWPQLPTALILQQRNRNVVRYVEHHYHIYSAGTHGFHQSNLSCLTWSRTCYSGSNSCYSSGTLGILQLSALMQQYSVALLPRTQQFPHAAFGWGWTNILQENSLSVMRAWIAVIGVRFLVTFWCLHNDLLLSPFGLLASCSHLSVKKRRGTFINLCYQPRFCNGNSINTKVKEF